MIMNKLYILLLPTLLLPAIASAQTPEKTDTLPAAIKTDLRGRQKTTSERIVLPKDFSLLASPTGDADFIKFVQTLPGVASGSDGSSSYYVRGGNMGGNLQTLDGVPIYGVSHLAGLTSPYPADVISSAEFQVGGFSSDEGNLSSSHIRLHSADGSFERRSAKAEVSNFLLGGFISTPIKEDKVSLLAALRVSPVQYEYKALSGLMDPDALAIRDAKAAVGDAYAKLAWKIAEGRKLSATVFGSLDNYSFDMEQGSKDNMAWNNLLAITNYEQKLGLRKLTVTGSYDHYANNQGMMKQMGQTSNNLLIRSSIDELALNALVQRPRQKRTGSVQYGLKLRGARFNPGSARELQTTGVFPKTSSPLSKNVKLNATATLHGQVERGSYERSMLRLAARLNYNTAGGFAPEASALLRIRFASFLGLELTGDYLTQFYHTLEGVPLGWSLDMVVPPSKRLMPERTRQAYAGLYSDAGKHHLSAGAYYKEMDNLVYFSDASKLFDSAIAGWEENIEVGTGTSKGVEFMYEKTGDRLNWRLAYTWSKTDRLFPNLNKGEAFPAKYDRTHVLNASASWMLRSGEKTDISLGTLFTYQSGHMETVTAGSWWDDNFITGRVEQKFYTSFNNYRMPPYIRWDISAVFDFKAKQHPQTLAIGVYNVLNRHNPFALSYDPDNDQWKQISLLPIMPSVKYSIKF